MVMVRTSAVIAFSTFSAARVPPSSPPDVARAVNRALTSVHRALKRPTNASTLSLGAASAARSSRLPHVSPAVPVQRGWRGHVHTMPRLLARGCAHADDRPNSTAHVRHAQQGRETP
jgi:hypothetical protein